MNEKISKIKLELLKEELSKQIKDSYILNLSMVLLDEFENLKTENKQLKENYERIYNENCILREKQYITDIGLLDENYKLKQVIDKAIECIRNAYVEVLKYDDEPSETTSYEIVTVDLLKMLKGE